MNNFENYLASLLDELKPSLVKDAMQYSLLGGGKRVRANLLFHTLSAYGVNFELGFPCAAGIEMIHAYSLIHDDLPAMDNDTMRRGKPTCHIQFGEDVAILAGDALLTQAFRCAASASEDAAINNKIVLDFVDYSGANGMILGQMRDLEGEKVPAECAADLEAIHLYKTGKLLTLPFLCAAYLTNHDEDINTWIEIGKKIGLSFQVQDDVLDVISTSEQLGKNANSDLENNKSTYVKFLGIEGAKETANQLLDEAVQMIKTMELADGELLSYIKQLSRRTY